MTEVEKKTLFEALKRIAPDWLERATRQLNQKKAMISTCLDIAYHSDSPDYQDEINDEYNRFRCPMNQTEVILLNYICLIRHKEHIINGINKDDDEIEKWLRILQTYVERVKDRSLKESVISCLDRQARQILNQYKVTNRIGRPKGKGKQIYSYNGKEYHTIQECADDYGITKQGMYKRLKKLSVI